MERSVEGGVGSGECERMTWCDGKCYGLNEEVHRHFAVGLFLRLPFPASIANNAEHWEFLWSLRES
jgi:hypothetical protein